MLFEEKNSKEIKKRRIESFNIASKTYNLQYENRNILHPKRAQSEKKENRKFICIHSKTFYFRFKGENIVKLIFLISWRLIVKEK